MPSKSEMEVAQHVSGCVESFEPQTANVSSLKELLELPWIKTFVRRDRTFCRFTLNRVDEPTIFMLITEPKKGERQVVAFVSGEDAKGIMNPLPVWTYKFRRTYGCLDKKPLVERHRKR
jgi:hypothetical protein